MELFKLTCSEVKHLKDETIENLIKFNRGLKVNYSSIKDSIKESRDI